jgi:hypothetical protein
MDSDWPADYTSNLMPAIGFFTTSPALISIDCDLTWLASRSTADFGLV